jgi:hypothetical protein
MRWFTFAPLTFGFLLPLACKTSGTSENGGRLCPHCEPRVGGETSDFGGGRANCKESVGQWDEAIAAEFGLDAVLDEASIPFEVPLRWEGGEHEGKSQLSGQVTLGIPIYYVSGVGDDEPSCFDKVLVPATVELATADGGIEATLEGQIELQRGAFSWELRAAADLAVVAGNRDLETDKTRPQEGELRIVMRGFEGERRGYLQPVVAYLDEEGGSAVALGGWDAFAISPWHGLFPTDECGSRGFPLAVDEPRDFLGDRSPGETMEAALASLQPEAWPACYRDGACTELSVSTAETSQTEASPPEVCVSGAAQVSWANVGGLLLATSDKRVNLALNEFSFTATVGSGEPLSLSFERDFEPQSPTELEGSMGFAGIGEFEAKFESEMGFGGIGHIQDPLLRGYVQGDIVWEEGTPRSSGSISVIEASSYAQVERLSWPLADESMGGAAGR